MPYTLLIDTVVSLGFKDPIDSPVTLNLDTTGKLYLVGSDGVVLPYMMFLKIVLVYNK